MKINVISVLLGVLTFSYTALASDTVPIYKLFNEADRYEGMMVTVTGEAIGDIMRDGTSFWINIKDGDFFIGVVMDETLKRKIRNTGRYRIQGDTLKISGLYNIHCKEHLGERDIHAVNLEVIQEGYILSESIDIREVVISFILALSAIVFVYRSHRKIVRKDSAGQQK